MGLALHEIYEVSGLVMGDASYKEYVPTSEELHLLKKEDPQVYETYWEVLCHFHIYDQTSSWRNRGVKQMSWASYLFNGINEKDSPVTSLTPGTDEEIAERIDASATPLSRTRILSDLIRSLKVFITRPELSFLIGPYWRAFLCCG